MSKTGKIIITVIASVVVLEALACFFVPRLLIFSAVQLLLPAVGEEAVYCTDYEALMKMYRPLKTAISPLIFRLIMRNGSLRTAMSWMCSSIIMRTKPIP